jgi:hypothetical protein
MLLTDQDQDKYKWQAVVNTVMNFMVTPCINDIKHFIVQLMHTTLKNVQLLKPFKN